MGRERSGMDPTVDELRSFCRQKLAPYKTPAHVEFQRDIAEEHRRESPARVLVAEHKARST